MNIEKINKLFKKYHIEEDTQVNIYQTQYLEVHSSPKFVETTLVKRTIQHWTGYEFRNKLIDCLVNSMHKNKTPGLQNSLTCHIYMGDDIEIRDYSNYPIVINTTYRIVKVKNNK